MAIIWHFHWCKQCEREWECGCRKPEKRDKWCPNKDLCHIKDGETVDQHTIPKTRRQSRGIGPLFNEIVVGFLSPPKKKDEEPE